ncbi:hypothetical protein BESB_037040 [Besnoitia besnoiti]|uniref:Methyltransferase n=1 Tax=Besnoitia besnoiti TaxID=94643 RepID=A0A2A9MMC6_BESBE|nr:hypothetical protein BESB_037040 [Besnoitia besnoiti]PFH37246.1 hypothetical protein BESB_037040 [Besnoitia besnoiti]
MHTDSNPGSRTGEACEPKNPASPPLRGDEDAACFAAEPCACPAPPPSAAPAPNQGLPDFLPHSESRQNHSTSDESVTENSSAEVTRDGSDRTAADDGVPASPAAPRHSKDRYHRKVLLQGINSDDGNSDSSGRGAGTVLQNSAAAAPLLAIEWKRFPYDFARGEFEVHGFPLYVEGPSQVRPAHLQQDADTGKSVWDGSVVLARFVEQRLFPPGGAEEEAPCVADNTKDRCKGHSPPPRAGRRRVILELGAGLGVAGLAAAAAGTHMSREHQRHEQQTPVCQGTGTEFCHVQRGENATRNSSNPIGSSDRAGRRVDAEENVVILTDLPYCLGPLTENVRRNRHFAVEKQLCRRADADSGSVAGNAQVDSEGEMQEGKSQVAVCPLDWNEPQKFAELVEGVLNPGEVEVILGADIVWLTNLVEPLAETIDWFAETNKELMEATGAATPTGGAEATRGSVAPLVVFLAHQTRSEKTDDAMFSAFAAKGLHVEVQSFDDPVANRSTNIRILKIWKYA